MVQEFIEKFMKCLRGFLLTVAILAMWSARVHAMTIPCDTQATANQALKTGDVIRMKVTAYCPCTICCGPNAKGITSKGDNAWVCDGVAADPKLIPYRTKLLIPGAGIREIDDTGGAMRQDAKRGITHIDLRFETHEEAKQWGVQWLDVKIVSAPKPKVKTVSS